MNTMLRIDLHTHPIEALKQKMGIKGILDIDKEVAYAIVKAVKSAGLNGIAITEHNNFNYGWVTSLVIREQFNKEKLIVFPGAEIDFNDQQFLRIYIPDRYRREISFFKSKQWFSVLAHPGYYNPLDIQKISQLDFDAVEEKSIHGEFPLAYRISAGKHIPAIKSSDAHKLEDIGMHYTDLKMR